MMLADPCAKKTRYRSRSVGITLGAIFALAVCYQLAMSGSALALEVIVFAGGFNWPIWAAQQQDYFANNGVEVHLTLTPGSDQLVAQPMKTKAAATMSKEAISFVGGQCTVPRVVHSLCK